MKNNKLKRSFDVNDILHLKAGLVSPQKVLEWSHGEVKKSETINYRTQRPEVGGLFDERTFGSERNYECACGKYRDKRYRGIICDKCGVEVAHSSVRRSRMGHIELEIPVAHVWYLKALPSKIALLLGLSPSDIQNVVYFASHIVTEVDKEGIEKIIQQLKAEYKQKQKQIKNDTEKEEVKKIYQDRLRELQSLQPNLILGEDKYNRFILRYSTVFKAEIGGEAIYKILRNIDLKKMEKELLEKMVKANQIDKAKYKKQLSLVRSFIRSEQRPEWMFFINLPIIPAALRPMMALDGGKYAVSDLNDLYRRVIDRNNRLKRMINLNAPEVIVRNEKRILQEAVDALIDGTIKANVKAGSYVKNQAKKLKSLTEYIGQKRGYFRGNLLGKRVDYSGRNVIVVGSYLRLNECGLPKDIALELFRPFVISKLLERESVFNIRAAGRLIDEKPPEVWKLLEEVIKDRYVLLNRAPTLHRQGIQAFKPRLLESKAIELHPLVCYAYNADFDGDTMAIHLPLTEEAQLEAKEIMSSVHNIINPGDRSITVSPSRQDMILGCYWMTKVIEKAKGEGKAFTDTNEAINAYQLGIIDLRAKIKIMPGTKKKYEKYNGKIFETTAGRLLFNTILPSDYPFVNELLKKNVISRIVVSVMNKYPLDIVVRVLDAIKQFGFHYATLSGITWSLSDTKVPEKRKEMIAKGFGEVKVIEDNYNKGLLSSKEKRRMAVKIWQNVRSEILDEVKDVLEENNPIKDIIASGARGSFRDLTNIVGMKGIISSAKGESIAHPITRCYKKGLNPIEYFVDAYGARKGLSDQALKTSQSGYFGRRLFDVAHDVLVREDNCKTNKGFFMNRASSTGKTDDFAERIQGRYLSKDVVDSKGKVIFKKGEFLDKEKAKKIEDSDANGAFLRSPLQCLTSRGVCRICYGDDTSRNDGSLIDLGDAVGTVAAQSIGEPSTQLTMDTVHKAGTVSAEGDITQGLPRVIELFDKRTPKDPAVIAKIDGRVSSLTEEDKKLTITISPKDPDKGGKRNTEYRFSDIRIPIVKEGDEVKQGQFLTDGSADLNELFEYAGREVTEKYLYNEITKVYERQEKRLVPKHYEVIIRQMFNRLKIKDSGDSLFSVDDVIEEAILGRVNEELEKEGKKVIKAEPILLGITDISITRYGFLSAASFQNTRKVLINAAIEGAVDTLEGLKENVILGQLVPTGTGYHGSEKNKKILDLQEEFQDEDREVSDELPIDAIEGVT